jgi:endonuclease YncB( thermonuclease family)
MTTVFQIEEHNFQRFPELTNQQIEQFELVSPHPQIRGDFDATVVKVHDGDTVTLRTDFRDFDFKLRLLSVDAPELSTGTPGEEARDFLSSWVLGQEVRIRINRHNRVGKYGRLLGDIVVGGQSMSDVLVQLGYAKPFQFRREGEIPDLDKIYSEFKL